MEKGCFRGVQGDLELLSSELHLPDHLHSSLQPLLLFFLFLF